LINYKKLDINQLEFPYIDKNNSGFKWTSLTKPCLLLSELAYGCDFNTYFSYIEVFNEMKSIYLSFSNNPILA